MRLPERLEPNAANGVPLTPLLLLERSLTACPGRPAMIWRDRVWTYQEFGHLVRRMAGFLEEQGIGKGDTVSIIAQNRPELLLAHFAVPMLGAVLNTINTRLDAETVSYILDHCSAQLVLSDAASLQLAEASAGEGLRVCGIGPEAGAESGLFLDVFDGGQPETEIGLTERIGSEWQPISINYTSGTTGRPKGVIYQHRGAYLNALNNIMSIGLGRSSVNLWTLPMFHCNGWSQTWAVIAAGGCNVCLEGVDPAQIMDALTRHGVTHMSCAPVVLYMLLDHADRSGGYTPTGRVTVTTGGAAPTAALIERMDAMGFELLHLYGLTESYGPVSGMFGGPDINERPASERAAFFARQGHSLPTGARIDVRGPDGATVHANGQELGEIVISGPTLMGGYHDDAVATDTAFSGGVFHTGDLAVVHEDGAMEIKDRAKDIIISGGENISSLEVESVLHRHPGVLMAAVVAAPHPKWGETPWAFVEISTGGSEAPSEEDLMEFCREHLAGFKVPRRIVFQDLPKTATGKIQKFALRHEVEQLQAETA
ncbi:AMP-binding protein [Roseibium sp.]|uniref:AMP-binding protein n=1 Tax=Roseibium sp. TaxID=1936156 RepID=UPI003A96D64B